MRFCLFTYKPSIWILDCLHSFSLFQYTVCIRSLFRYLPFLFYHGVFSYKKCCFLLFPGISRKTRILDVMYNASNNELVRTKTLVKNAVIQIDATPFKQW